DRDWSSDVCSSDLDHSGVDPVEPHLAQMFLPSINRVTFRFKRRSAFDVFYLAIIIEVLLSVVGKSRCASQDWQLSLATIYPQFFHFGAGLSRGGSPFERNPPNFPFARVLI